MGRLAKLLSSRQQGNFPSSTEVDPKEQCQPVTLRSGTKYDGPIVDDKGKKTEDKNSTSLAQEEVIEDLPKIEKLKYTEPTPRILILNDSERPILTNNSPNMEEDEDVAIILGRPFFATGDSCFSINVLEEQGEVVKSIEDPLELSLVASLEERDGTEASEYAKWLNSVGQIYKKKYEELGQVLERPLPSIEKPSTLELKTFPDHLRYAYLGENNTLPIIISTSLSLIEEEKLLRVLMAHKLAIGWTLTDIKGISPSMVMHHILMEEESKPSIDAQRRLNPSMKEVVRKEILKWLDVGVIYPISDSALVSPVQVVPKKGGMAMVKNDNNELIPTRTITGKRICIDYRKLNKHKRIKKRLPSCALMEHFHFGECHLGYVMLHNLSKMSDVYLLRHGGKRAFKTLKEKLVSAPIIVSPNWELPLELMCDANDYAVGAVLGQRIDKVFRMIYYASRTLNDAQLDYATFEKELLAIVFVFDKFRPYLIGNKKMEKEEQINENFLDEQLFSIESEEKLPWFADYVNYLVAKVVPLDMSRQQLKRFYSEVKHYYWDETTLFRHCDDQVIKRCVPGEEMMYILTHFHTLHCGGHFGGTKTATKVLQCGFYWPMLFKDASAFVKSCDHFQRASNISRRGQMSMTGILEVELFDLWE
ncbi:uncharacterized protein LOC133814781 [Humulus lupulus]|uniref:uncharacterized protein LOC133814781 n=1 Tax=Humulus lupulus TaxID=3486 RepID=UPI002B4089E6|nr:uncharacterized protein LOC133814781 [Humulus lupulus]